MGVLEVLIVLAIALVVFGGYFRKRLPEFGRKAGTNTRIGAEKARELADAASAKARDAADAASAKAGERIGDRLDPAALGRQAGKGLREAREFRDSFNGPLVPPGDDPAKPKAATPEDATPEDAPRPAPAPDDAGAGARRDDPSATQPQATERGGPPGAA